MANGSGSAVAWIGLAAAGAAIFLALRAGGGGAAPAEEESDLTSAGALEGRLADAETRLEAAETRMREYDARIAKAEQKAASAESEASRALQEVRAGNAAGAPTTVGEEAAPTPEEAKRKAEVQDLLAKIRAGEIHDVDGGFGLMARAKELGVLDEALKEMEAYAAAHASDPDAQVELASAYVVKLMAVPDGMERGAWSRKSIEACEKALKIQPDHWGAQFMKGMNLSQWPDYLGKRPEAIKTFERLVEQQEKSTAAEGDDFAETYFQLGTLYQKSGNSEKAMEVFRRGLAAHPEDKKLREQIELLEKR